MERAETLRQRTRTVSLWMSPVELPAQVAGVRGITLSVDGTRCDVEDLSDVAPGARPDRLMTPRLWYGGHVDATRFGFVTRLCF